MPFHATTPFCHLQAYSDGPPDFPGPLLPEQEKKKGRNKRAPKGDKPPSRYKKRKKEGDERQLMHSGPDTVMTQIKQVRLILPCYIAKLVGAAPLHFYWNKRLLARLVTSVNLNALFKILKS